jgi:hypothetical protein
MNKIASVLIVALVLVACTQQTGTQPEQPESGQNLPSASPVSVAERRTIDIYATIFHRQVTKDHTFSSGPSPFDRVFIVSGVVKNGRSWRVRWKITEPFSDVVKAGLRAKLRELPPLTFVSGAEARRISRERMNGGHKRFAVILSVGPIDGAGSRVEVSNSLWCGGLCALWSTYVIKKTDGRWRTTGTTGPMVIS